MTLMEQASAQLAFVAKKFVDNLIATQQGNVQIQTFSCCAKLRYHSPAWAEGQSGKMSIMGSPSPHPVLHIRCGQRKALLDHLYYAQFDWLELISPVPPLVFAGAPVVSVFVAMLYNPPEHSPSPVFFIGILMAAVGAGLVLAYRPT